MTTIDITVSSEVERTMRVRQVSAMFDAPIQDKCELHWKGDFPFDAEPWNVGLIVGASGSGKSTIAREVFGEQPELTWSAKSVVDDFPAAASIADISGVCSAVGFNTIPAWLRRYAVLSNGEKFRVDVARRLIEAPDPIVVDEFTSVVDRQVAQVGSHAIQKYVRAHGRKFVAVSCHFDIVDWLQPDWILDAATMSFQRRRLQRRPPIECTVGRVHRSAWALFAPFHYMSADLSVSARAFALWAGDRIAAFAGVLHRPHPKCDDIKGVSRLVTLPDWQGVGLALALVDELGAAHRAVGLRLRTYPAHPALIRSFDRSKNWRLEQKPKPGGGTSARISGTSTIASSKGSAAMGTRPCAVFEYCGPTMDKRDAERLIAA
jgi:ABC-type lipoprotein export system ATPase subunit